MIKQHAPRVTCMIFTALVLSVLATTSWAGGVPTSSHVKANADLPDMKTVMQLAIERENGSSSMPQLHKWIVPNFPVPESSHDLHGGSNPAIVFWASTPKKINSFYMQVLPALGWTVVKHLTAFGYVQIKTCKGDRCAHISAGSAGSSKKGDHKVRISFGPKHLKPLESY